MALRRSKKKKCPAVGKSKKHLTQEQYEEAEKCQEGSALTMLSRGLPGAVGQKREKRNEQAKH